MRPLVALLGSLLGACSADPNTHEADPELASQEFALNGALGMADCSVVEQDQLLEALQFGREIAASGEFQACVRGAFYTPCNDGNVSCEFGGECSDPSDGLEGAVRSSQSPNAVQVTCRDLPGAARGTTEWEDAHDIGYAGTETFLVDTGMLQTNRTRLPTDGVQARADVAATLWHEAMHVHGYDHGEGDPSDCGSPPGFSWQVTTVPYIVGDCMRSTAAIAIQNAWQRGAGRMPSTTEMNTLAQRLASGGYGLADVEREAYGVTRRSAGWQRLAASDPSDLAFSYGNFDGTGRVDSITGLIDHRPLQDVVVMRVERECGPLGCTTQPSFEFPLSVSNAHSLSIGVGNVLGDVKDEIVVSVIERRTGFDAWRVGIGTDCARPQGCHWISIQTIESGVFELEGGGAAVGTFSFGYDGVMISGIDSNRDGEDAWLYTIAPICVSSADCLFSPLGRVPSGATILRDGDVALGQLDGDIVDEIVLSAAEDAVGFDTIRYVVGDGSFPTPTFSAPRSLDMRGVTLGGGRVEIADVLERSGEEVIFAAYEEWSQGHDWHWVGTTLCDVLVGECTLTHSGTTVRSFGYEVQGHDISTAYLDGAGDTGRDIVLAARVDRSDRVVTNGFGATTRAPIDRYFGGPGLAHDPGNTRGLARDVALGFAADLAISSRVDEDWFRFYVPSRMTVLSHLSFTHAAGDLDMQLYDWAGNALATSAGTADTESIGRVLEPGTYYVRVYGYARATGTYRLSISRWDFVVRPIPGAFESELLRQLP